MEESTPKRVHPRNLISRLCFDAFESRHLTRVFGRASKREGSKEDLASNIRNVCGINITESDSLSRLICRKCDGSVSKASDFRQRRMNMQIQLEQHCSVKRCVELSPSVSRLQSAQPARSGVSQKALPRNSISERLKLKPYNENL